MKRLIGVITIGLLAIAIAAYAQPSKKHATRSTKTVAVSAAGSICGPGNCGGCSRGAAVSAATVATVAINSELKAASGMCNGMDPSKCPVGCRKAAAAGATTERLASR